METQKQPRPPRPVELADKCERAADIIDQMPRGAKFSLGDVMSVVAPSINTWRHLSRALGRQAVADTGDRFYKPWRRIQDRRQVTRFLRRTARNLRSHKI